MKKVFVCSPLRGKTAEEQDGNYQKALCYCRFAVTSGTIPFAPHVYYVQFLDDHVEEERSFGIDAGMRMMEHMDELWVFGNPTEGMQAEIDYWRANYNRPIRQWGGVECKLILDGIAEERKT